MNIVKKISKCLSLVAIFVLLIAFLNKLIYVFSKIKAKESFTFHSNYYEWRFGKIHYFTIGNGKPILLIHSLINGTSNYEFNKVIKKLSAHHKVYAIDLIGFGKSDKPKITYTAYLYVQLIHDFIKDIIGENTDIVTSGNSNSFVTMLSLQNKNYINRLIFINPGKLDQLSKYPSVRDILIKRIMETPVAGTCIYNSICSKHSIKRLFRKKYLFAPNNVSPKLLDSFYSSSHIGDAKNKYVYASAYCNYLNVNIKNALDQINNSIFIIQGEYRGVSPDNISDSYKNINFSIESSIIHNTKEFPHLEKPDATSDLISLFCN